MINHRLQAAPSTIAFRARFYLGLKWFSGLILAALLIASMPARAQESTDDQFLHIYSMIDEADTLKDNGKADLAKSKYQEAQRELLKFKKSNPTWNTKIVAYRLSYLAEKLSPPRAPETAAPATVENVATAPVKAADKPKPAKVAAGTQPLKLLEAGAEPRRELRIHPKAGDKQTLVMTMKMEMENGVTPPMKMPGTVLPMDITVKSVSPDGDIVLETVVGEATVANAPGTAPQMLEAMKASLSGVKGMGFTSTMSNRGINKGIDIKPAAGASPQLHQAMEQMKDSMQGVSCPLPEEAVGPGAKWEVNLAKKTQGMTLNQTMTYELVSIKGDRIELKSTITQDAPNQKIANPAVPQVKTELTKMTGSGSGTMTFDLAQAVPSSAIADTHTEMAMSINAGGKKQDMNMKMDMNIRLEAK